MIDMIEQVADAIDEARYRHPEHPRERPRPFSEADEGDREYATRLARAAIEAMREPTDDMLKAGCFALYHAQDDLMAATLSADKNLLGRTKMRLRFGAMLSAALSG